jgi:hypothetical protein
MFWTNEVRSLDIDAARHGYAGAANRPGQDWREYRQDQDADRRSVGARYI